MELREQIARKVGEYAYSMPWEILSSHEQSESYVVVDQILAFEPIASLLKLHGKANEVLAEHICCYQAQEDNCFYGCPACAQKRVLEWLKGDCKGHSTDRREIKYYKSKQRKDCYMCWQTLKRTLEVK